VEEGAPIAKSAASPRRKIPKGRNPAAGILDARHLGEIRPDEIDQIDMQKILEDSERVRNLESNEPDTPET
jgi:hypothetical protein